MYLKGMVHGWWVLLSPCLHKKLKLRGEDIWQSWAPAALLVCNTEAAWEGRRWTTVNRVMLRKQMPSKGNAVLGAAKHKAPAVEEEKHLGGGGGRATAATATTVVVQGIPN